MTPFAWERALVLAGLLGAVAYLVVGKMAPPLARLLEKGGLSARNYTGRMIPTGAGVAVPFGVLLVAPLALAFGAGAPLSIWLLVLFGMSLLGILDDAAGNRKDRGFVGHLRALAAGRLTTGAVKALFAPVIALIAAWQLHRHFGLALLSGTLIALATNLVNLLDVRPGRAIKGFFLLAAAGGIGLLLTGGYAFAPGQAPLAGAAAGAALALWRPDLEERVMIGDAGANALGAAAGLWLAGLGWGWQALLILLLGVVHVYAEGRSLSEAIGRIPLLDRIDRWGRKERG